MHGSSPGEVLREARRSRDLSIEYVARQLRLTVKQIDALENDNYKLMPASIFVQGYIRGYASLLGLDSEPLVRRFIDIVGETPRPSLADPLRERKTRSMGNTFPVKGLGYLLTSAFILFGLTMIYSTKNPEEELAQRTAALAVVKKPAAKIKPELTTVSYTEQSAPRVVRGPARYVVSGVRKKSEHDTLSIRFKRSTYVEVFDANNKALLKHKGRAGFRDKVRGKAPFRIKLGSPENVVVRLNGEIFHHLKQKKGRSKTFLVKTRTVQ